MTTLNFDLVTPEELTGYVRTIPFGDLALSRILPDRSVADTEFRYTVGNMVDVEAAQYRTFDTPAPIGTRPGTSRKRGAIPPISRKMVVTEEEILRLRFMETGDPSGIIRQIYDDAHTLTRGIQVRLELARGEAINTGKLSLNENGVVATVDYGRLAGHNVVLTGTALWSDTTNSVPVTNLRAWVQTYIDNNGVRPGAILMSNAAVSNLLLNAQVRAMVANNQGVNPVLVTRDQLNAVLGSFDLPPIVVIDTKYNVAGTMVPVLPANRVVMVPPTSEPLGHTLFGVTAEAMRLAGIGRLAASVAPGIVAVVEDTFDPVHTWTKAAGLALPLLANPNLTFGATVG